MHTPTLKTSVKALILTPTPLPLPAFCLQNQGQDYEEVLSRMARASALLDCINGSCEPSRLLQQHACSSTEGEHARMCTRGRTNSGLCTPLCQALMLQSVLHKGEDSDQQLKDSATCLDRPPQCHSSGGGGTFSSCRSGGTCWQHDSMAPLAFVGDDVKARQIGLGACEALARLVLLPDARIVNHLD